MLAVSMAGRDWGLVGFGTAQEAFSVYGRELIRERILDDQRLLQKQIINLLFCSSLFLFYKKFWVWRFLDTQFVKLIEN